MNVKIYTTPTCTWCIRAKDFFKKNGVKYTEVDVAENQANAKKMIDISGQSGTPVITVDKQVIVGFDESKLKKALNIK